MHLLFSVALGIGLLLCGIFCMRQGLENLLGGRLRKLITTITVNPWRGLLVGIFASALMQSSTAVSLITIGLVSANYLSFYQSLGIILGANIGTCTTVQLMTLSLPGNAIYPLLLLSVIIMIFVRRLRCLAMAVSGLLSIFAGIEILSAAISNISELHVALQYILAGKTNALYGIAGGMLITLLLQSSSAATAVLMVFAADGTIDLTTAAYVVYGNNIGSCISSVMIAAAAPLAAKRVAAAHVILNIAGAIIFLPFTGLLTAFTTLLCADFAGQIALLHTLFNLLSSLAVMPFAKQYAQLIIFLIPGRK